MGPFPRPAALTALCAERAEQWRCERPAPVEDEQAAAARAETVSKLEAAIARLTDAVEAGQPVGDGLKQRTAELVELRLKAARRPEPPPALGEDPVLWLCRGEGAAARGVRRTAVPSTRPFIPPMLWRPR